MMSMAKQGGPNRRYRGSAKKTRRGVAAAYEKAAELDEIVKVTPSAYRVDHSPILRDGEAYVFPTGTVAHDALCAVVAERWDEARPG